jgi:tripartite-type tricarboxylate transporter receptor subunit TctC
MLRAAVFALCLSACTLAHAATYPDKPIRLIVPFAEADAPGLVSRRPARGTGARSAGLYLAAVNTSQKYPDKPIRLIVPFAAGGGVDVVARIVSQLYAGAFGQPMVIDNRGGSGGVIAADIAAHAVPDGYTLFLGGSASHGITPHLYRNLPYDAARDFTPVSLIGEAPYFLIVHPAVPAASVGELIALAQARPGQLNYGSAGNGSTLHLTAELFRSMAKINIAHVPYKGGAPALTDLLAGQLQFMFAPAALALPQTRAGRLRALGVSSEKRAPFAPEIPAIAEAGVPGYVATGWYGLLGPRGLPQPVTDRLSRILSHIYSDKEFNERCTTVGVVPLRGGPAEFARFIQSELAKWGKVVRDSGARID